MKKNDKRSFSLWIDESTIKKIEEMKNKRDSISVWILKTIDKQLESEAK